MTEHWKIYGRHVTFEDAQCAWAGQKVDAIYPPPGLLISLGDGSACESSAERLADAIVSIFTGRVHVTAGDIVLAQYVIERMIQQAPEAR